MISDVADEIVEKLFSSLKNRYYNSLQLMRGSDSVFDYFQLLLYYRCHKINLNRCRSSIDSPEWIKTKRKEQIQSIRYNSRIKLRKKRSTKNNKS